MELVGGIMEGINSYLWGVPTIGLLFGTHLFLTFQTGFIQRRTFTNVRLSVTRDPDSHGNISQFAAPTTALASTIGTGNIIGVGATIALGGSDAVLWCWLTDVFGIATRYGESLVVVKYRMRTEDGTMLGGAMYALERSLGMRQLGITFAVLGALASFGIGCGVQVNAIPNIANGDAAPVIITGSEDFKNLLNTYPWSVSLAVGLVMGGITCLVVFGGMKLIAKVCKKLAPFMTFFYVMGCLMILFINRAFLGQTLSVIFKSAFTEIHPIAGGLTGTGIIMSARYGIARGLFSNESGMGPAPIMAAAAQTRNPVRQAPVSITSTFWDTVVTCLMTGLVLVSSIVGRDTISVTNLSSGGLANASFNLIPYINQPVLIADIITFAYSTILGWSCHGERCLEHPIGRRGIVLYRMVWIAVLVAALAIQLELAWSIADTLNALVAIPNLAAALLLSGMIVEEAKYYLANLDERDNALIPLIGDQGVLPLLKKQTGMAATHKTVSTNKLK